ncbi:HNH endonuclease (plasmid) [Citrobacter portucalensis]|uniref:HNH endonuclease n=1 Tax=Citrobacter portucalensis TaxID=1639133 RepID=UPI00351D99D3
MNDYKQMYLALCHYYQQNPPTAGYCEVHHITPRHVGGSDEAKNLVTLPFYYHVMAHVLYAKWKQTANAWAAVMMMTGNAVRHGVNIDLSHVALLREQAILAQLEKHLLSKKGPRYLNIEIIVLGSEIDAIRGARRIRKKSYAKVFRASVRAETSRLPVCGSAARRNRRLG